MRCGQKFYKCAQDMYWQTLVNERSGNAQKLWNTLSAMMGSNRRLPVQPDLSADLFLRVFCDEVDDVRSATAGLGDPSYSDFEGIHLSQFSIINLDETRRLLMDAPVKFCALDPVPTRLVKDRAGELAPFMQTLFNKSLSTGCFPSSSKSRNHSNQSHHSTLLFLEITGLSQTCAFCRSCWSALQTNNYLIIFAATNPKHQPAYWKSHSTETALLKVTSDALLAADRGMVNLHGLLDLSAAFACVDHRIFLRRLEVSFGISAIAIDWIRSYLEDREQCVRYNGSLSQTVVLKYSVPQDSVLGPLCIVLYTSDVFELADLQGFHVHGYADDLQLYDHCLPCDMDILSNRFSSCVDDIPEWMSSNRL